jgi:hypothetical protein
MFICRDRHSQEMFRFLQLTSNIVAVPVNIVPIVTVPTLDIACGNTITLAEVIKSFDDKPDRYFVFLIEAAHWLQLLIHFVA